MNRTGSLSASQTATSPLAFYRSPKALAPATGFFRFSGFGGRVDRLRRGAGAASGHLNATGLRLFSFRQRHAQHAVVVFGGCSLSGNCLRQSERTCESAIRAFDSMVVVSLIRLFKLALTAEGNDIVLNREIEIFLFHSRKLGLEHDLVLVLIDVNAGRPCATANALIAESAG